jgi:hypothetical protein
MGQAKEHDAVCQTVRSKTIGDLVGQVGEVITTEEQVRVMTLHDRIRKIVQDERQAVIVAALLMLVSEIEIENEARKRQHHAVRQGSGGRNGTS